MLALSLSPFLPTQRFGLLTAAMLVTALLGDLVLLPALLALGSRRTDREDGDKNDDDVTGTRKRTPHGQQRPHFVAIEESRVNGKPLETPSEQTGRRSGRSRRRSRESIPA